MFHSIHFNRCFLSLCFQVCKELFNLFLGWPLFGPPRAYNNTLSQMQSLRNQLEVVGRYEFQPKVRALFPSLFLIPTCVFVRRRI